MKYILFIFLFYGFPLFSQLKIDSVRVYSSSLDFYLGRDPYEYILKKFKREREPLVLRDSIAFIENQLLDTVALPSPKKAYVYFIFEVYSGSEMKTYFFDDKRFLYFNDRKYKKMKVLYNYFIERIEENYNKNAILVE